MSQKVTKGKLKYWFLLFLLFVTLFVKIALETEIFSASDSYQTKIQPGSEGIDASAIADGTENNYGFSSDLYIGQQAPVWWTFLKFDLSAIPEGAEISSATLSLYYYSVNLDPPEGFNINVHRVIDAWDESTITWSNKPAISSPYSYSHISADGWHSVDVKEIVLDTINNNNGFALTVSGESCGPAKAYSSDSAMADLRPKLEINYTLKDSPSKTSGDIIQDSRKTDTSDSATSADRTKKTAELETNEDRVALTDDDQQSQEVVTKTQNQNDTAKRSRALLWFLLSGVLLSAISALLIFFQTILSQISFKDFFLIVINYLNSLFHKKESQKFGIVYDQFSEKPILGALVQLFDRSNMRLIKSTLTNKRGEYYFQVKNGDYVISVVKRGYIYPSIIARKRKSDKDVYYGQTIRVLRNSIINKKIPVDPAPSSTKSPIVLLRISKIIEAARILLIIYGTVYSIIVLNSTKSINFYLIVFSYLLLWVMEFYIQNRIVKSCLVIDKNNKEPIDLAIIRSYNAKGGPDKVFISDYFGRVFIETRQKNSLLVIEKNGYKKEELKIRNKGFLEGRKFYLKKN